jgi:Uma2 family endonuclease
MATTEKLMTAEEFARMPEPADGTQYELVRGELVMMTPASPRHGVCCLKVGAKLLQFAQERQLGWVAVNDPGVITERNPDTVRGPDIAFWSRERLPELPDKFTEVVPDLAVEVVSPSDTHPRVTEKVLHYLDHGVRLVWVVDPDQRIVSIYRSRQDVRILGKAEQIVGDDVLAGFTCQVSEFFDG